ncbi:MAG TPA: iron uptake transporter deferrochelatase/peroxidase subunit [Frankiaceae bacterium]|nr:iron uptake transporter deferrochelatase/peroxidase subunit [Frankiaceae bacterium]
MRPTRRGLLGAALGGVGAVVAGGAGYGIAAATEDDHSGSAAAEQWAFYGSHQAGIATPAQDKLAFAAFDVTSSAVDDLQAMLGAWAAAASRMTAGLPVGSVETLPQSPPVDTGEALGLPPASLTITVGFGPTLFDDRFGLESRRPAALADLPALPGDALDPTRSGGDLCVQACSNDPQVAFHVIRNFARIGRGTAVMRWSQLGFGRTSTTSTTQATPRNLMGFKDGTNNIKSEDSAAMDRFVWVGDETDQPWMRGGSYLVSRRIRMLIESWDADYLADQQNVFGRAKDTGAPLNGTQEFDKVNLTAKTASGELVIPAEAHIRLASPDSHGGQKILRRGYSYTDGNDPTTGQLDAGLFFIAFQKDPRKQFVPIQQLLGRRDALNEYIKHVGSGVFAVPPGVSAVGDWFGKSLFR